MYAKIQKGKQDSYMIIESEAQITVNARVPVFDYLWDYMCQQQETAGKCGDDNQNALLVSDILQKLGVNSGQPFLIMYETDKMFWYGMPEQPEFKGKDISVAHVNIDGVSYLTEGNVYILNDKGQTIQKI